MNEYYEQYEELRKKQTFKGEQWFGKRSDLVGEYSWAIPSEDVLLYLSEFEHIIEVGAGNGYWAHCIEDNGGSVEATDIAPPEETWHHVEPVAAVDLNLVNETVLMVWPPYDKSLASDVIEQEPAHILYVGEPAGGCTGDEAFFTTVNKDYGLVAKLDLPSYEGINDDFFHYIRKT
jgi:hypothetical protein